MWKISPCPKGTLEGTVCPPSSKSHTLRAILLASLAKGRSTIDNVLASNDTNSMLNICRQFGAKISYLPEEKFVEIEGIALEFKKGPLGFDCGNSGIAWRFVSAICALRTELSLIYGDHSILFQRPIEPLTQALSSLACWCKRLGDSERGPLAIKGMGIRKGNIDLQLDGLDSQPVSALLFLASCIEGEHQILVKKAQEIPWLKLTEAWLSRLKVQVNSRLCEKGYLRFTLKNPHAQTNWPWPGFHYVVPGDFSSASALLAACMINRTQIEIEGLDFNDSQGDKEIFSLARKVGVKVKELASKNRLLIDARAGYCALGEVDCQTMIDMVPILCVLAIYANEGLSCLKGVYGARYKECDRVEAIRCELAKIGADIQVRGVKEEEFIEIKAHKKPLRATVHSSYCDHRMVMALSVAALGLKEPSFIDNTNCVAKTYPLFAHDLNSLGCSEEIITRVSKHEGISACYEHAF